MYTAVIEVNQSMCLKSIMRMDIEHIPRIYLFTQAFKHKNRIEKLKKVNCETEYRCYYVSNVMSVVLLPKIFFFLEKSCFLFLLVDCASICGWLKLYDTVRFYPSVKSLPIEAVDGYVRLSVHSLALSIQRAFLRALPLSVSGSRALSLCLLASLSVSIA